MKKIRASGTLAKKAMPIAEYMIIYIPKLTAESDQDMELSRETLKDISE